MLNPVCDDPQSQHLHMRYRLGTGRTIGQYAWQVGDLTQPAAIFFLFSLYRKMHSFTSNHGLHLTLPPITRAIYLPQVKANGNAPPQIHDALAWPAHRGAQPEHPAQSACPTTQPETPQTKPQIRQVQSARADKWLPVFLRASSKECIVLCGGCQCPGLGPRVKTRGSEKPTVQGT